MRTLAAATPTSRNRVVDLLRALAILVVVLGHWLIAAVVVVDGELRTDAVLNIASWTHPLTWLFQVMPVFFVVGGYANGLSWRSAQRRGLPYAAWLRGRLRRLGLPLVPLLLAWLAASWVAQAAGAPASTLHTATVVALMPTWFLAAYVLVVAVAPATLALWSRFGWWTVAAGLALGGAVDLWSIAGHDDRVGFANYLVVWASVQQLGFAWLDGRLPTWRHRAVVAAVGAVGLVLLVWPGPYPVSMVGLDTTDLNNTYPTRVSMGFLGLAQAGLLLLLEPRLARLLQRPRLWTATVAVNARIMSLYLWHPTAMILLIGASLLAGGTGLHATPLTAAWWAGRPLWVVVLGVVVLGLATVVGRLEDPVTDLRPAPPAWRPVLATAATCGGVALLAASGLVTDSGVHWAWALLPPVSLVALGVVPLRRVRR